MTESDLSKSANDGKKKTRPDPIITVLHALQMVLTMTNGIAGLKKIYIL